ncbi:prolipoprotein diacylglyceryl transferase [Patescibacteria group bacterium]
MIPYFELNHFSIGPLTIQVWGSLVALGIIVGAWASTRLAKSRGQNQKIIWDAVFWIIVGAFLFARLVHVFIYEPGYYLLNLSEIITVWHGGFSIIGGFLGAAWFGLFYLKRKNVDVMAYADTLIFGLPLGLFLGRLGCFFIHDHPGLVSNFILSVKFPDQIARHDHGLYLSLNGLLTFLMFVYLARQKVRTGTYLVVFLIWYGVVRFGLDFLRAQEGEIVDSRYLSFTPAQYGAVIMVLLGLYLYKKRPRDYK